MNLGDRPNVKEVRDAIVRAFSFLHTDYAFKVAAAEFRALGPGAIANPVDVDDAPNVGSHDGVVTVRFESAEVVVNVGDDPRTELTCQLYRRAAPTTRIDLFHICSFVGASEEPSHEWAHASLEEILTELSGALARHGGPWLRGDHGAWQNLLRWWAEGMPATRRDV